MSEAIEPAAQTEGGREASTQSTMAPAGTSPPQPLGIVRTFAWIAAGVVAGLLSAILLMFAAIASERLTRFPIDGYETAIVWSAAGIAELAFFVVIVIACRRSGWRATDYFGLVRPKGRYVRWTFLAFCLSSAVTIVAGQLGPLGGDSFEDPINLPGTVWWFVSATIVAPVAEELIVRGFLYRGIAIGDRRSDRPHIAAVERPAFRPNLAWICRACRQRSRARMAALAQRVDAADHRDP